MITELAKGNSTCAHNVQQAFAYFGAPSPHPLLRVGLHHGAHHGRSITTCYHLRSIPPVVSLRLDLYLHVQNLTGADYRA